MYRHIISILLVVLIAVTPVSYAFAFTLPCLKECSSLLDTNKMGKKVKASFPGGEKEMFKYIGQNLIYPEKSKANNIEGRVIVEFIVSKEGVITEPYIVIGLDQFCDKEVIRIVTSMPNWTPATLDGLPIDSKIKLPISFKTEKDFRKNEYFLDTKSISEKEFNKIKSNKIKTLVIEREEFLTKMNVFSVKMLKLGPLEIQNITQSGNKVSFDLLALPENGVIKTEIIDGNGMNLSTKMILVPTAKNKVTLTIPANTKKPVFLGINQLGTTMNINLTN